MNDHPDRDQRLAVSFGLLDQLASVSRGLALQSLRDGEPLMPLSDGQAVAQALRLRSAGLSYSAISAVMRVYHGHAAPAPSWRARCRRAGAARAVSGALAARVEVAA